MKRLLFIILSLIAISTITGCASVRLGSIPRHQETSRLRLALIPVSENVSRGGWKNSKEDFTANQYKGTAQILERLGYYEVVPESEIKTVLSDYSPDIWSLTRNNSEMAIRIGKALYADYVMLAERGMAHGDERVYYFELMLINVNTGRKIGVRLENDSRQNRRKIPPGFARMAYRQLFRDARSDLLYTAMNKGRKMVFERLPESERKAQGDSGALEQERLERDRLSRIQANERKMAALRTDTGSRVVGYEQAEKQEEKQLSGARSLIVYDLNAQKDYQPAAAILSEAIREEILRRRIFNLINRENMQIGRAHV